MITEYSISQIKLLWNPETASVVGSRLVIAWRSHEIPFRGRETPRHVYVNTAVEGDTRIEDYGDDEMDKEGSQLTRGGQQGEAARDENLFVSQNGLQSSAHSYSICLSKSQSVQRNSLSRRPKWRVLIPASAVSARILPRQGNRGRPTE